MTDRDELDKQIEKVLKQSGSVPMTDKVRASSGHNLREKLGKSAPRLICSLVHKFGRPDVDDFDEIITERKRKAMAYEKYLNKQPARESRVLGVLRSSPAPSFKRYACDGGNFQRRSFSTSGIFPEVFAGNDTENSAFRTGSRLGHRQNGVWYPIRSVPRIRPEPTIR